MNIQKFLHRFRSPKKPITLCLVAAVFILIYKTKQFHFRGVQIVVNQSDFAAYKSINTFPFPKYVISSNQVHSTDSDYILFASKRIRVPKYLPSLPNHNQVIGYSFKNCNNNSYSLVIPTDLEGLMFTKSGFRRFIESRNTISSFSSYHNLHFLQPPCRSVAPPIQRWKDIPVEQEPPHQPVAVDTQERIPMPWQELCQ